MSVRSTLAPEPVAYRWTVHDGIGGSPRVRYADVPPGSLAAQGIIAEPLYTREEMEAYARAVAYAAVMDAQMRAADTELQRVFMGPVNLEGKVRIPDREVWEDERAADLAWAARTGKGE